MNLDAGDGIALFAALFAGLAWCEARKSAKAATTAASISKEGAQGQSVRWSVEKAGKHYLDVYQDLTRRARLVNDGTERALNVHVSGGLVTPEAKKSEVVPGRAIEFDYRVGYREGTGTSGDPPPEVFEFRVGWNRPQIVGGERLTAVLKFDPTKAAKAPD
jgi:hypothetical protein